MQPRNVALILRENIAEFHNFILIPAISGDIVDFQFELAFAYPSYPNAARTVMVRLASLSILLALIIFLGITFFQVIAPFLLPLFLAGVVTILFQPVFRYFLKRTNQRVRIAAGLTTASVMAILLIPLLVGTFLGAVQLYVLTQDTLGGGQLNERVAKARDKLQRTIETNEDTLFELVQPLLPTYADSERRDARDPKIEETEETREERIRREEKQLALQRAAFKQHMATFQENTRSQLNAIAARSLGIASDKTFDILGALLSAVIGTAMFMIGLYYFLADGPSLLKAAESLIPVHAKYQRELLNQFDRVVRAVVLATFLAAIGQGLATALGLYVVGFHHFFIFFVVATFASLVPLAGTWLIWVPCAVMLAMDGHWFSAIVLALYGSIVIGTLDNVIRTFVLQSDAKLHPLLAFVSVLGGLKVMGLWGVFFGPIVACCLHALIQIFNDELKDFTFERRTKEAAGPDDDSPADATSDSGKTVAEQTGEREKPEADANEPPDDATKQDSPIPADTQPNTANPSKNVDDAATPRK